MMEIAQLLDCVDDRSVVIRKGSCALRRGCCATFRPGIFTGAGDTTGLMPCFTAATNCCIAAASLIHFRVTLLPEAKNEIEWPIIPFDCSNEETLPCWKDSKS
ncbi:hypothetical protein [Nocardioides sp.]|uniref:hypothetical protein n=1 Tax=Nocardioides sp. TaxID=35761 RepID=UPI003218ED00